MQSGGQLQVDLDRHIPPELYISVAELLAWMDGLENRDEQQTKRSGQEVIYNYRKTFS